MNEYEIKVVMREAYRKSLFAEMVRYYKRVRR